MRGHDVHDEGQHGQDGEDDPGPGPGPGSCGCHLLLHAASDASPNGRTDVWSDEVLKKRKKEKEKTVPPPKKIVQKENCESSAEKCAKIGTFWSFTFQKSTSILRK